MSNAKRDEFTPGPWVIRESEERCRIFGSGIGGLAGSGNHVCNVFASDLPDGAANARLIAAAPDMLAALRLVAALGYGEPAPQRLRDKIRAAIAKAEGR